MRTKRLRPTTISTHYQEDETLDTRAEYDAAVDLLKTSHAFASEEEARRAREEAKSVTLSGGESVDVLAGDRGDDDLDVSAKPHKSLEQAAAEGVADAEAEWEADKEAFDETRRTLAEAYPSLTPRQLNQAAHEARELKLDLTNPAAVAAWAEKFEDANPDFHTPLEDGLKAGTTTVEKLTDDIERFARAAATQSHDPHAKARLTARLQVLGAEMIREARAQGLAIDEPEVMARLQRLAEAATEGGDGWVEIIGLVADFTPIVGEIKSGIEAVELYQQLGEAEAAGDEEGARAIRIALALAVAGAVPFLGKIAKGAKLATKVSDWVDTTKAAKVARAAADRLSKSRPVSFVQEQVALRKWMKWQREEIKKGEKFAVRQMAVNNPLLAGLNRAEFNKLQGTLNQLVGAQAEIYMRTLLNQAKLAEFGTDGKQVVSLIYQYPGRRPRIVDAAITQDAVPDFYGLLMKRMDRDQQDAFTVELKTAEGKYGGYQAETDRLINEAESVVAVGLPTKGNKKKKKPPKDPGPDIQQVRLMHLPVEKIPRTALAGAIRESLAKKGFSKGVIDGVLEGATDIYGLPETVRKRLNFGAVVLASLAAADLIAAAMED